MSDITITTYRHGWLVGTDETGALVAIDPRDGLEDPTAYPVAPVVEVDPWHLVVLCPVCKPKRRNGRPVRHTHGRGDGPYLAEGHRVGHGEACSSSSGYVVLLLDTDRVVVKGGSRLPLSP